MVSGDVASERILTPYVLWVRYIRDTKGFKAQANILYDLVDEKQLDRLVMQDLMCNLLEPDEVRLFYERYRSLPIVSLGRRSLEGIPCIQSNGYEGMRKAIVHLIEVHGHRRIAFIGLPKYRPHDERYQAYVGCYLLNMGCHLTQRESQNPLTQLKRSGQIGVTWLFVGY